MLIGISPNEGVLYSLGGLRVSNPPDAMKVGQSVEVSFPHPLPGISVSTVNCEVLWRRKNSKSLEMLCGLKFTDPPERVMKSWVAYFVRERGAVSDMKEKRFHTRADCELDVLARRGPEQAHGLISNISLGGAFIKINRPAEPGDEWGLDISGQSNFPGMHYKARVLTCEMGEAGLYEQRVSFITADEESKKLMQKYLLSLNKNFWSE